MKRLDFEIENEGGYVIPEDWNDVSMGIIENGLVPNDTDTDQVSLVLKDELDTVLKRLHDAEAEVQRLTLWAQEEDTVEIPLTPKVEKRAVPANWLKYMGF